MALCEAAAMGNIGFDIALGNRPRLIALRGGDRIEGTLAADNERGVLMRRAWARTLSPRSSLLLKRSLQPTPSPLRGLAPCLLLGAFSMYPGE